MSKIFIITKKGNMDEEILNTIRVPISGDNPCIERDEALCIRCGACKRVCHNDETIDGYYTIKDEPICVGCGQCIMSCPTHALHEKYEYRRVRALMESGKDKIFVISTAPACRVALAEEFGGKAGQNVEGKLVTLLRNLGFKYVFDVTFGADLTIMEEANELLDRLKSKDKLPMFTSCCPSWVKFVETFYPDLTHHLSSAKSPIGMQGAIIKTYFAKAMGLDPKDIVNVVIAPCTAKKFEIRSGEMHSAGEVLGIENMPDTDYCITTREVAIWAKIAHINFKKLVPTKYDDLLGRGTGAGVIFGASGGVMESAIRMCAKTLGQDVSPYLNFEPVRGGKGVKTAEITLGGRTLHLAVVHGLNNVRPILEDIRNNKCPYDFIEVMNCVGGCVGGGGQPYSANPKKIYDRMRGLYDADSITDVRVAGDNPDISKVYADYLGRPNSEIAKKLLHTTYIDRSGDAK